jgi:hypothetical protein
MEEPTEKSAELTKDRIQKKFETRRAEISKEIYQGIEKLSNLKTLKDSQIQMLSLRQRLLEDSHTLLEHITVLRRKHREEKTVALENISSNLQLRYQATEKSLILEGKTASTREYLDIFENQVSFFNDSIKTIDNVIFGIKTRLDIEKTLGL